MIGPERLRHQRLAHRISATRPGNENRAPRRGIVPGRGQRPEPRRRPGRRACGVEWTDHRATRRHRSPGVPWPWLEVLAARCAGRPRPLRHRRDEHRTERRECDSVWIVLAARAAALEWRTRRPSLEPHRSAAYSLSAWPDCLPVATRPGPLPPSVRGPDGLSLHL